MVRVDLHTHSKGSGDGGISSESYGELLKSSQIDCFAITDHQDIDYAKATQETLNDDLNIIVGQEIKTTHGEIIGLFLNALIPDQLSPEDTVREIRKQSGFCLIPHPEDKYRSGLSFETMDSIREDIDAIEIFNGRTIGKPNADLKHWARSNNVPGISSSDAHSASGVGRSYTELSEVPISSEHLRELLTDQFRPIYERPALRSYLAPEFNRMRNRFRRS